jgi:signal transduction histidine kinase
VAVLVAWGAGEAARSRRRAAADHAAAAEQVRALTERGAVTRERVAIARELHDVVAHHVSMIAVRAATGPYEVPDLPPPAQAAFREIAEEARTALTELRTILGVLRADAGIADRPQPRLANLPGLLDRMGGAGPVVTLRVQGMPRSLPESVELCGYRIVQEALTNAGRHSPGSQAEVELMYMPDALQITVRNGGPGGQETGHPRGSPVRAGGFGVLGMRERVTTLGGLFDAGPDRAGGFVVTARVPVSPPQPSSRTPE